MDKPKIAMTFRMLGKIAVTPALLNDLGEAEVKSLLQRHQDGDWGNIADDSRKMNKEAIETDDKEECDMVMSQYIINGEKVWIKTYLYYSTVACYASED